MGGSKTLSLKVLDMTNGRALSQLQPRSQRRGCCGLPPLRTRGWMSCTPAWGPLCSHTCLPGCIPPTASRSLSQLDFLLFLGTAGVVLGTEISLFSTSFHPYNTAYEKWTFFLFFHPNFPPSISIVFFI